MNGSSTSRFVVRDLPLAARLVVALFLISVGIGYFSALVQLHLQDASPGKMLPDREDVVRVYYGKPGISELERLLTALESEAFNGSGTMRPAFTTRSPRWQRAVEARTKEKNLRAKDGGLDLRRGEIDLRIERDGERLAVIDWVRAGAPKDAYEADSYAVSAAHAREPITEKYLETDADDKKTGKVKIKSIVHDRCVRCHREEQGGPASQIPLDSFEEVRSYCEVETVGGGMSLRRLAQSTHVHLLGFAMLYGLTGLIFTCTSYPGWMRLVLGPFTLLAQLADIACWWLGRMDPIYAQVILYTGSAVAGGLFVQITLSLFNMFGRAGRVILVLLLLAACFGGYELKEKVLDSYLSREATQTATSPD
jgi:hypothetical protein